MANRRNQNVKTNNDIYWEKIRLQKQYWCRVCAGVKAKLKMANGKNQNVKTNIDRYWEKSNYKSNIGAGYVQV